MKALLIDASPAGDARTTALADEAAAQLAARGCEVERVTARELDVRACAGCFGCWVRTPGECVIGDDARAVAASAANADVFAIVTPVRFGSYGSLAKSVLDRMICLISPHFTMVDGEIHHAKRYERYPRWVALGTSALTGEVLADEAAVFERLAERNSVNFHSPAQAAGLAGPEDAVAAIVARVLDPILPAVPHVREVAA